MRQLTSRPFLCGAASSIQARGKHAVTRVSKWQTEGRAGTATSPGGLR